MANDPSKNTGKKKFVFAKDEKQARLAIIVAVIFVLYSIFLIGKNIVQQMPSTTNTAQNVLAERQQQLSDRHNSIDRPIDGQTADATAPITPGTTIDTTNTDPTINTTTVNTTTVDTTVPGAETTLPPGTPPANGEDLQGMQTPTNPVPQQPTVDYSKFVLPVVAVLFLLLTWAAITFYKKNAKNIEAQLKTMGGGDKKMPSFAKDEKQAIAAIVIIGLFIANGVYLIAKNIVQQMPVQTVAQSPVVSPNVPITQNTAITEDPTLAQAPTNGQDITQDANNIYSQTMNLQEGQPTINTKLPTTTAPDEVEILVKGANTGIPRKQKMVSISVSGSGRTNPFLPASENIAPSSLTYLTSPPESIPTNSDAEKVMTTVISGILYDKNNPSAIINIEGTDYLVKKGDLINRYKILAITPDQVLVQLGKNVYKAGVGELLSQTNINYNTIANLNKKFGGNSVSINVKKKKKK